VTELHVLFPDKLSLQKGPLALYGGAKTGGTIPQLQKEIKLAKEVAARIPKLPTSKKYVPYQAKYWKIIHLCVSS
jgi:hypothetical protein